MVRSRLRGGIGAGPEPAIESLVRGFRYRRRTVGTSAGVRRTGAAIGGGNRGRCCQLARAQLAAGDLVAGGPARAVLLGRLRRRPGNAVMVKVTVPHRAGS